MSGSNIVLQVTKQDLEDDRGFHVQVDTVSGKPETDDLLEIGLTIAAAAVAEGCRQNPDKDLEDVLDEVWNKIADMVETTQRLSSDRLH